MSTVIKINDIIKDQRPQSISECLLLLFQAGIRRQDMIDISSCPSEYLSMMKDALRTYKRGMNTHPKAQYKTLTEPDIEFRAFSITKKTTIIDSNVYDHWKHKLDACTNIIIEDINEQNKNFTTFLNICDQLKNNPEHVYVIGGGIVCDVGAFCCAFLGIPFTLVPTTLLAMIDASIGGKCGVNFEPYGKNQVGLFASASKVLIDTDFLSSLDEREYRSGLAEAYKHYYIQPSQVSADELPKTAFECREHHIRELIHIKQNITAQDPKEQGVRKTLNFGHTFGHALEALLTKTNTPLLHGEAVAWGIVFANFVSVQLNEQKKSDFEQSVHELHSFNLFIHKNEILTHWNLEKILFYMQQDKKNNQDIQMVLYSRPGALLGEQYTHAIKTKQMSEFLTHFYDYLQNQDFS